MTLYALGELRPRLAPNVYIAPTATVIGDVVLGEGSSVWFACVLRGDVFPIRIGARTNLQDGTIVHVTAGKAATTVGDDVTVGHRALLHGCTLGNRILVGMGASILDHATVGDECIIGAGSLVTPRSVIPPRSLVMGRPARVVRTVTDQDVEDLLRAGRHYVENGRLYASSAFQALPEPGLEPSKG